jgi:hypothetical protein
MDCRPSAPLLRLKGTKVVWGRNEAGELNEEAGKSYYLNILKARLRHWSKEEKAEILSS